MKHFRSVDRRPEIPTSSMADIAFLLIIFFMVTAVFSATKGLAYKLPPDDRDDTTTDPSIFIQVFRDRVVVDCDPMAIDEVLPYLEPRLTRNPNKPVILHPDADSRYQDLVSVYDLLTGAGRPGSYWGFEVRNIFVPTSSEVADYEALFGANPFAGYCP